MAANNGSNGIEAVLKPMDIACLRRSTRAIDEAVVQVDGSIIAIQSALESIDGYEFITVRQLLTGAARLLKCAQDEIGNIDAELDRCDEGGAGTHL